MAPYAPLGQQLAPRAAADDLRHLGMDAGQRPPARDAQDMQIAASSSPLFVGG